MKRISGRRVKHSDNRKRRFFVIAAGFMTATLFVFISTADKLHGAIEFFVNDSFAGNILTLELNTASSLTLSKAVAAQSFVLSKTPIGSDESLSQISYQMSTDVQLGDRFDELPSVPESNEETHTDSELFDENIKTITVASADGDGILSYDGVYIKNNTMCDVDVQSFLESDIAEILGIDAEVLVVQTHASEAFYPIGNDYYIPTDIDRTEDTQFNVVSVGDVLVNALIENGIKVTHLREIYDFPTYSGSYTRTLTAIEQELANNPNIKIVVDVHRDAMITSEGIKYRTVTEVGGRSAAQIMFVMGTGEGGLSHPEWRQNLTLAVSLQKRLSDKYPSLCRPLTLSKSRYNQHTTAGSMIVEFGTSANTLAEAKHSAELFAIELSALLNEIK